MKLLRSFPILAFTLVLLSLAAVCVAQQSVGLLLVAGTLAAISWYITEGPRGRILPKWVSNLLVVAVSLNVFVDLMQHQHDVIGVLGRFAVWLTLIKLYERRTARDYAHLLTLSLLLIITSCLQTNDLLLGIILTLYVTLGLYVLLLHQLHGAYEAARLDRQRIIPADYRLIPPLKPIMGKHPTLRFRVQAVAIAVLGLIVSVVVFLGVPRDLGANMLGLYQGDGSTRRTQFSWNIDLNIGGRITDSRVKVCNVELLDNTGQRIVPSSGSAPLRLRGAILDEYLRQGRWDSRKIIGQERLFIVGSQITPLGDISPTASTASDTITQKFTLARSSDGLAPIFSMYAPTAVAVDSFENRADVIYDPLSQTIRAADSVRHLVGYTVQAHKRPSDETLVSLTSPVRPVIRQSRRTSGGWFSDSDLASLRTLADAKLAAARIAVTPPDTVPERWEWNRAAAGALSTWLQSTDFTYTTDLSSVVYPNAEIDPIVRFVTTTRRGHCEFFASGLTALCYSKGIPARVVVGYIAYDFDEAIGQYNVLESNAHAWVEVATGEGEGRGWTTFDPTPPATLRTIHDKPATLADQVRWAYQRIEGDWTSSVVGFDGTAQSKLADNLNRSWSRRVLNSLESFRQWMQGWTFYFGPTGAVWLAIVALAVIIAVIAIVKVTRRVMALRRSLQLQHVHGVEYQRLLRHLGFYLDMLKVLQRAGIPKPSWQPPMEFSRAVRSRDIAVSDLVEQITNTFYAARYGHHRMTSQQVNDARKLVRTLAERLNVRSI